jgi:hypothetical protein
MGNDMVLVVFAVLFPVLLIGELVLLVLLWRSGGGRLPRIVQPPEAAGPRDQVANDVWMVSVWLIATGLAMTLGFVAAFVAVHVLLFTVGTEAAMVGLIVSAIFLAAIPVAVALLMRRRGRGR